jgi:hypothetical protein
MLPDSELDRTTFRKKLVLVLPHGISLLALDCKVDGTIGCSL